MDSPMTYYFKSQFTVKILNDITETIFEEAFDQLVFDTETKKFLFSESML